jgi:large subunit ribosomal protein L13
MKKQASHYATNDTITKNWVLIDATDQILGRLAARVAKIARGKEKPDFTPSMDTGDFVIVINADKIRVTGKKLTDKVYYRHTGYPGGLKETVLKDQLSKDSTKVIMDAVKGMLPSNKIGRAILKNVKVYSGSEHPHDAQQPTRIELKKESK